MQHQSGINIKTNQIVQEDILLPSKTKKEQKERKIAQCEQKDQTKDRKQEERHPALPTGQIYAGSKLCAAGLCCGPSATAQTHTHKCD